MAPDESAGPAAPRRWLPTFLAVVAVLCLVWWSVSAGTASPEVQRPTQPPVTVNPTPGSLVDSGRGLVAVATQGSAVEPEPVTMCSVPTKKEGVMICVTRPPGYQGGKPRPAPPDRVLVPMTCLPDDVPAGTMVSCATIAPTPSH